MTDNKSQIAQWNELDKARTQKELRVSTSRPIKQSNYGTYKTSISYGEGMELRRINITGDTAEIVQEIANNAAQAPAMLTALNAMAAERKDTDTEIARLRAALHVCMTLAGERMDYGSDGNAIQRIFITSSEALKEPVK